MPAHNSIKEYAPNTYYHAYNRGLNKQNIFRDKQDYAFFLRLLCKYLDPNYIRKPGEIPRPSFCSSIELLAYCLMPNHYHLLVYQLDDSQALEKLFRSMMTAYSMYFNQKYQRIGPLLQGRYKASRIVSDAYLYHISRYIHLNPLDIGHSYHNYPYSSFATYQDPLNNEGVVKTDRILGIFNHDYARFVDEYSEIFKTRTKLDSQGYNLDISGLS